MPHRARFWIFSIVFCTASCQGGGPPGDTPPTPNEGPGAGGMGGGNGLPPFSEENAECALPPQRIWRLTPEQYELTLKAISDRITGDPESELAITLPEFEGFVNSNAPAVMTLPHTSQTFVFASRTAGELLSQANREKWPAA